MKLADYIAEASFKKQFTYSKKITETQTSFDVCMYARVPGSVNLFFNYYTYIHNTSNMYTAAPL